ncbi:MAG: hypothetical protein HQK83_03255 [Fibrobacteria bacterium]|nr:hypothetical protein [Fibrobacteria bacterium]
MKLFIKNMLLFYMVCFGLFSCAIPVKKSDNQEMQKLVASIPAKWKDETAVKLKDSTHIFFSTRMQKKVLCVRNISYIYVAQRNPNLFERIFVNDYETIEYKPTIQLYAFYPDNKSWQARPMAIKRFRTKENEIYESNRWVQYVDIPKYQEKLILRLVVTRYYFRPEFYNQVVMRDMYNVVNRSIKFSVPKNYRIRFGFLNNEKLDVDTVITEDENEINYEYTAKNLLKIDDYNRLVKPEEWYASLHMSLPPSGEISFTWKQLGDYYLGMISQAFEPSREIIDIAANIKSSNRDSIIKEAFLLLRQKVRYHADEKKIYAIMPRPAKLIINRGYGDCKEMSSLLKVLLREKGIETNLALTITKSNFQLMENYPSLGSFNHMLLSYKDSKGLTRYIDPTVNFGNPASSFLHIHGQKALLIKPGNTHTTVIDAGDKFLNKIITQSSIQPGTGTVKWQLSGNIELFGMAAFRILPIINDLNQEEKKPFLTDMLKDYFNLNTLSSSVIKLTSDYIKIQYKANFNKAYVDMDKGGFVLESPSLFGGQVRYTTLEREGPRFFEAIEQYDSWQLPPGFTDFELTNIDHAIATGKWQQNKNIISRQFINMRTNIQNDNRESLVSYFKIRKKFSNARIWKK